MFAGRLLFAFVAVVAITGPAKAHDGAHGHSHVERIHVDWSLAEQDAGATGSMASIYTRDLAFLRPLPRLRVKADARVTPFQTQEGREDPVLAPDGNDLEVESCILDPVVVNRLRSNAGEHTMLVDYRRDESRYWRTGRNLAFSNYYSGIPSADAAALNVYGFFLRYRECALIPGTAIQVEAAEKGRRKVTLLLPRQVHPDGESHYTQSRFTLLVERDRLLEAEGASLYGDGEKILSEDRFIRASFSDFDERFARLPRRIEVTTYYPSAVGSRPAKEIAMRVTEIEPLPEGFSQAECLGMYTEGLTPYTEEPVVAQKNSRKPANRRSVVIALGAMIVCAAAGVRLMIAPRPASTNPERISEDVR